ncbi:LTA synthase family protein [Orbaceae bacterium ac157xtp]
MLDLFPVNAWITLPLIVITVFLASLFKSKIVRLPIILVMTIFIVMELVSIYFSGGFIDYQFYVNLNVNDIIEGLIIFKFQAVLTIVVFLFLLWIMLKFSRFLQQKIRLLFRILILILAIIPLNYRQGPFDKLVEIYRVVSAPKMEFDVALKQLGMVDYVHKSELTASKGKNIIVISLESFEQNFMNFDKVTPNLRAIRDKYTFYPNMPMGVGSSWTTASMYTYMTGMPFLVGGGNTTPLSNVDATNLISLGDVLHKAGYQTDYIIGSPTFAGIGHIISFLGFNIISEKSYPGQYPDAPFGLYDKDIFDIAKRKIEDYSHDDKPFALFISTISTHAPNGFYDARMESVIDKNLDNLSFAGTSLDYNLGQFIRYLEDEDKLDNTVFYIFPDHLMMGSGTKTIAELAKNERLLYLITNATSNETKFDSANNIYQIDLPVIILNGADISTNARFLTDYLPSGSDKKAFIDQHKSEVATINRSAGVILK